MPEWLHRARGIFCVMPGLAAGIHDRRISPAMAPFGGYAARTRLKKLATLASRSCARADRRSVQPPISSIAAADWFVACSTDLISSDARAVLPAAVWMLLAISRVVAPCWSTAAAIDVETDVSSWM